MDGRELSLFLTIENTVRSQLAGYVLFKEETLALTMSVNIFIYDPEMKETHLCSSYTPTVLSYRNLSHHKEIMGCVCDINTPVMQFEQKMGTQTELRLKPYVGHLQFKVN